MKHLSAYKQWHAETVSRGEEVMAQSRVAICCMVRDCRSAFEKNLKFIDELRTCFNESKLVIVENDSTDGTKELVQSLEDHDGGIYVDTFDTGEETLLKKMKSGVNPSFSYHRVEKMANYRNRYLRVLNEDIGLDAIDWVIMLDPDVVKFSLDGIKHSFGQSSCWDVVHANGRSKRGLFDDVYYDAYAFAELGDTTPQTEVKMRGIQERMIELRNLGMLLPVRSGFNALAIYRAEVITGLSYSCVSNPDPRVEVLCEHVAFHDAIAKKGFHRHYLNPVMRVQYNSRINACVVFLKAQICKFLNS
ncbi:MAG: hypothetical protein ABGY95_12250 [Rubritalea sp.]|uniref:hypothetical protein n=1 Tax=Rubritalea sp. TaxID=2109375 RepID=UPI0032425A25